MKRKQMHILYEVDLDRQTAFCVVCGYTEIFIPNTRPGNTPKPICIAKARKLKAWRQERKYILDEEKRSLPTWQPRHTLTEFDPVALRAICAVCGPTDVQKTTTKGKTRYDCATKLREYNRKYQRTHRVGRPSNPHALSEIDEENETAVCATCGPVKIEIEYGLKKITRRCINAGK
ncbi:MAG TPA: hypothetical protein VFR47_06685 [Anaerolineales bacterium]|nr:hypothetical protein [Anaerolineales bacterium]